MVLIAFDYGTARTGVAIANGSDVRALTTLKSDELWAKINDIIDQYHPAKLVVGLPRNLNGEPTSQTALAEEFGRQLGEESGLPVEWQDEALSSQRALERLDKKTTIANRKKLTDQISAQIILEDYIKTNTI